MGRSEAARWTGRRPAPQGRDERERASQYLQSITSAQERVKRLSAQIETLAREWRLWPAIEAVMCFRGFQVLSATLFLSELGDLDRFAHPTHLMAYLGLLPSEHSSGDEVRKGAITKCGNSHVRWILVEAAQHYLHPPKVSQELSRRQQGQPQRIKEISWSAQNRLYRRHRALVSRGKRPQKAMAAIARELAGFLWALYREWKRPGSIPARAAVARGPRIAHNDGAALRQTSARDYELKPAPSRVLPPSAVRRTPRRQVVGSGGTRSHR